MARRKARILTNSSQGAFATFYHGKTRQACEETYFPDGTECYLPESHRADGLSEGHVRAGTVERTSNSRPVLVPDSSSLYLYDVYEGDGRDECHVVPAEHTRQCSCGAWIGIGPFAGVGVHIEGCTEE